MISIDEIIKKLNLQPHPTEGGYFIETYRSNENIKKEYLPTEYKSDRSLSTCIYFLLTKNTFSEMHRLKSDEIFHFYIGDPVEMLHLYPNGEIKKIIFGNNISYGMIPQVIVPKNVWQGAKLSDGGKFALMGTTVAPGFDFTDYESGKKDELIKEYPEEKKLITELTRI